MTDRDEPWLAEMTVWELDEILIVHWPNVIRKVKSGNVSWLKSFVLSVAKHGKNNNWHPTRKQAEIMRRLVSELGSAPERSPDLIER